MFSREGKCSGDYLALTGLTNEIKMRYTAGDLAGLQVVVLLVSCAYSVVGPGYHETPPLSAPLRESM